MLARQRGHRQAAGARRLRRVSLRLAGGCLSGDGLRLLGPSSTHDCLVGFPGERRGWQIVRKTCVLGPKKWLLSHNRQQNLEAVGSLGPEKKLIYFGMRRLPLSLYRRWLRFLMILRVGVALVGGGSVLF